MPCARSPVGAPCEQGVLTPHPGEMAALLGVPLPELETDRVGSALR